MGKYIETFVNASKLLFVMRNRSPRRKNQVVEIFEALTIEESTTLESGQPLNLEALIQMAERTGVSIEECRLKIDYFLYWRAHSSGLD